MRLNSKYAIPALCAALATAGCATVTPPQLVEARDAYDTSAHGPAGKLAPAELYEAKKDLDMANYEYAQRGDTVAMRDFAYITKRKTEIADVKARIEVDRERISDAQQQGIELRDARLKAAHAELEDTRTQLKDQQTATQLQTTELKAANTVQGQELQNANSQLDQETHRRLAAEANLAKAMKDLETIAAVKQEPRGVVITLNGSVLFPTGKFSLLSTAMARLDQVAEALKDESADKRIVVEGHTDSRGGDSVNMPLSLARATAVRDYLVSRGVDSNRISAVGLGSTRPLVDNDTAENRANNRRVEIVIQSAPVSMR